jgi:flagellar hook-basal body complex protein FliE
MSVDALNAANAYRNQLKLMQGQRESSTDETGESSPFAKLLQNTLGDAINAQSTSENLQTQSLTTGKVELSNLVTAVANAELSLNTVVAIRDRVINAYNDIIKMSI